MCELFALSASAPVDIKLSFAELARHGGDTGIHADGWGAAFLEGRDARLFREPSAAASSPWVRCLQDHPIQSDTVIAHVRHATKGAITLANTQPFARELRGRVHVFVHNGHLGDLVISDAPLAQRYQPIGETDSEAAFCMLMARLAAGSGARVSDRSDGILAAFSAFAGEMRQHGPANMILASVDRILVHADRRTQRPGVIEPPGLWLLCRNCGAGPEPAFSGAGVSVASGALNVVLIASVPLTNEPWEPLARGTVLELRKGHVEARRFV